MTGCLRTWGYVEFETEAEAKNAIQGLKNGSFSTYGNHLKMKIVKAVGALPMDVDDWIDELAEGWVYKPKVADASDESKGVESPNPAKLYDPADVNTGDKGKAIASPSPAKLYDPADVDTNETGKAAESRSLGETHEDPDIDTGDKDQTLEPLTLFAIHRGTSVHTPDKDQLAVAPKERAA